mmetsp:Transcript_19424/g.41511  ORF Transcript_19424/g.41511 Transcript_19424/m.41511 type:complete len:824 (+) Transcript_19424:59-2530(+)
MAAVENPRRVESLPSIDESALARPSLPAGNGDGGDHRRVATDATAGRFTIENSAKTKRSSCSSVVTTVSSCPSSPLLRRPTESSKSPSSASEISPRSSTALNTKLLQNMTRSHKNRDPYRDYLVLDVIGKGSIGSVEKVVRRHHGVIQHDHKKKKANGLKFWAGGGIFNGCCLSDIEENGEKGEKHRRDSTPSCFWGIISKLFDNERSENDAFQPTNSTTNSNSATNSNSDDTAKQELDGSISIVSEASAFSAPPSPADIQNKIITPTTFDPPADDSKMYRSSSQRGAPPSSSHLYRHRNAHAHPLRKYALKSIRLSRMSGGGYGGTSGGASSSDEAELRNEISILRSLDHPHIVHVLETYEFLGNIYMVIDLCENGDLYVWDPYTEGEARAIARQLLRAISYMHHRGIVHRDLKYENVMFSDGERSKLEIKLIDFGLSKKYGRKKGGPTDMSAEMTDFVGTIYTMAPEVIKGGYTYKCDLWSLGVMTYMLLSSQIPFCGKDMKSIARKITWGNFSFSGRRWSNISKKGRDFVSSLLVLNPSLRPTADHALKHPWLAGEGRPSFDAKILHRCHSSGAVGGTRSGSMRNPLPKPFSSQICASIEKYSAYSWMHRLALMVIAYRYTGEETTHLRQIFTSYDIDDSGTVEADELRNAFALHGKYTEEEIDRIFLAMDMNGSGKISWTEFLASTIETKGPVSEEEFSSAFEHLDFDKNGYISTSDLREIIGRDMPQNIIDRIIDESDIIGDNKIWKDEFLALGGESNATSDNDHQHGQRIYLKRSKSADDFDLVKTESSGTVLSVPDDLDQFYIEKAKSVRKATKFV